MLNTTDMRSEYIKSMRENAHEIIAMAYNQMDASAFGVSEEPDITGELVRMMKEFLESYNAPDWVSYYSIKEDPPLNVDGRFGKHRPRVDIEFERIQHGPRPRLRFEAKRLGTTSGHSVSAYLGSEGMGCFISGKYPVTHKEAGMLGYVQSGNEIEWSDKIEKALSNNNDKYCVVPPPYQRQNICSLEHTYVSHHSNLNGSDVIFVNHVLLLFC